MTVSDRAEGTRLTRLGLGAGLVLFLVACQFAGPRSPAETPKSSGTPERSVGASANVDAQPSPARSALPTASAVAEATAAPSLSPDEETQAKLVQQAQAALAQWAAVARQAPPNAVVFVRQLADGGGWRGEGADENKGAFLSGLVEASIELPTQPPSPGEVVWPDGSSQTVSVFSAAEALADLARQMRGGPCTGCEPLEVIGAELVTGEAETSRGTAMVPLWQFKFAPADEPLAPITYVAVKDRIFVPPGPWNPQGENPIGKSIDVAYGSTEDDRLTVSFVGSPSTGEDRCGADYTGDAVESDSAVVVIVHEHRHRSPDSTAPQVCRAIGATRTAVAALDAPLGNRVVLEVQFGTPVTLRPRLDSASLPVLVVDDLSTAVAHRIEDLIDPDGCVVEVEIGTAGWPIEQIEREAAELPGGVGFVLPRDAVYVGEPEDAAVAFGAIEAFYGESEWAFIAPYGEQAWLSGLPHQPGEWVGAAMARIELSGGRSAWAAGYYAQALGYDNCRE